MHEVYGTERLFVNEKFVPLREGRDSGERERERAMARCSRQANKRVPRGRGARPADPVGHESTPM
jgi:hypothetical protein